MVCCHGDLYSVSHILNYQNSDILTLLKIIHNIIETTLFTIYKFHENISLDIAL
jgi:hypothetical protein